MKDPFLLWKRSIFLLRAPILGRQRFLSTGNGMANFIDARKQEVDSELKKRIFNTILWESDPEVSFTKRKSREIKNHRAKQYQMMSEGLPQQKPLTLNLLNENATIECQNDNTEKVEDDMPRYPYAENIKRSSITHHAPKEEGGQHSQATLTERDERSKRS